MGLLNYIEDEPSLFGGVLPGGSYYPTSVPPPGSPDQYVWGPIPEYLKVAPRSVPQEEPSPTLPTKHVPMVIPEIPSQPPVVGGGGRWGIDAVPLSSNPDKASLGLTDDPSTPIPRLPWPPSVSTPSYAAPAIETNDRRSSAEEERSSVLGVAKALGAGTARGVIGLVGLPGDAVGFGRRMLGYETGEAPTLGSEYLQKRAEAKFGPFYRPHGKAEEFAETFGTYLPAIIGGPEGLATRFLARVAAPAVASEAAGQYFKGSENEKRARIAAALIAGGGSSAAAARWRPPALPARPSTVDISSAPGWYGYGMGLIDRSPAASALWYGKSAASSAGDVYDARRREREAQ